MRCSQFKKHYSEFRDSLITSPVLKREMEHHLAICERCSRHNRAFEHGLYLIREAGDIEPPSGFHRSVMRSVTLNARTPEPVVPAPPAIAAAAMLAAAVAVFVFEDNTDSFDPGAQPIPAAVRTLPQSVPAPQIDMITLTELQTFTPETRIPETDDEEEPVDEQASEAQ